MAYNNNKGGNYNNFDLNNYETVKSRKTRLRNDHPDSIIYPLPLSDINYANNYVLIGALIWKDKKTFDSLQIETIEKMTQLAATTTPQNAGMVMASIGIAAKADGVGYSLSIAGGKGADKNAWVENAEESAIGRALDNMGYHSGSASQEEMKKVQHMQEVQQERVQLENQVNALYTQLMAQGHNVNYINNIVQQSVGQFTHLNNLSIDQLNTLVTSLNSISGGSVPMGQPAPIPTPNMGAGR
ncbi:hypothetical protein [Bacillus cereus]|uniref:hypothetical protein n=1 Tax=Bacillus cereus TaxID=1396 RepID=UPI0018F6AB6C|nr:hypothetical protein [Bacillus cereus]MBJ7935548.1 hypothetical protein [Bacillus cereus]